MKYFTICFVVVIIGIGFTSWLEAAASVRDKQPWTYAECLEDIRSVLGSQSYEANYTCDSIFKRK